MKSNPLLTPLKLHLDESLSVSFLRLSGRITEDNPFPALAFKNARVIVDLRGITHFNSCGIRDWVKWITSRKERLYFVECSTVIIIQANMIYGFLAEAEVLSLQLPLYCAKCDDEFPSILISLKQAFESSYLLPNCQECDFPLEVGDDEESFFHFLKTIRMPQIDHELLVALKQFSPQTAAFYQNTAGTAK